MKTCSVQLSLPLSWRTTPENTNQWILKQTVEIIIKISIIYYEIKGLLWNACTFLPHTGHIFLYLWYSHEEAVLKISKYYLIFVVLGQRNWQCMAWRKPLFSGGTFRADFCQICHMELLGSGYRGLPGCLPNLGIIIAVQDFLQA